MAPLDVFTVTRKLPRRPLKFKKDLLFFGVKALIMTRFDNRQEQIESFRNYVLGSSIVGIGQLH